jgi:hypothetical protein
MFSVTFERYFPHDDADDMCEPDERGFVVENVSLRDAVRLGLEARGPSHLNVPEADSYPASNVRWLSFSHWNDGTREYIERCIIEDRALHLPKNITPATRRRIARLFGVNA